MNSVTAFSAVLRPVGWAAEPAAKESNAPAMGRQAAAWFNGPVVEGSQVLRAPVQPGVGDVETLRQRFLASFQDNPLP